MSSDTSFSIRRACELLSGWTGLSIGEEKVDRAIKIVWPGKENKVNKKLIYLGEEGYLIRTEKKEDSSNVVIMANTTEGATNGVYGLWRRLKINRSRNPFGQKWEIKDVPAFKRRGIWAMLMPWGFEELAFDAWTFKEWKEYLERVRSLGGSSIFRYCLHYIDGRNRSNRRGSPLFAGRADCQGSR